MKQLTEVLPFDLHIMSAVDPLDSGSKPSVVLVDFDKTLVNKDTFSLFILKNCLRPGFVACTVKSLSNRRKREIFLSLIKVSFRQSFKYIIGLAILEQFSSVDIKKRSINQCIGYWNVRLVNLLCRLKDQGICILVISDNLDIVIEGALSQYGFYMLSYSTKKAPESISFRPKEERFLQSQFCAYNVVACITDSIKRDVGMLHLANDKINYDRQSKIYYSLKNKVQSSIND